MVRACDALERAPLSAKRAREVRFGGQVPAGSRSRGSGIPSDGSRRICRRLLWGAQTQLFGERRAWVLAEGISDLTGRPDVARPISVKADFGKTA